MRRPGPLAAALPAGLLLLAACGGVASDRSDRPAETSPPPDRIKQIDPPGSVGLDINYLDESGQIKTLPVKDFNR